jgi:thiamine biosynthesis lipoprotein
MGTTYNITIVDPPNDVALVTLQKQIDDLLEVVNQQMSTYINDAEIMQFNRAPVETWFPVSSGFLSVIELSQQLASLTKGRFDITIGPLVELWGFGKKQGSEVPTDAAIADAQSRVGWQNLHVNKDQQAIRKDKALWLDVSAVAKGYGVDQIAEILNSYNIANYLVEIGGEMRVKGLNQQQRSWRIGIEVPSLAQRQAQQIIELTDKSIATSGDYRNFFEQDGHRYSHTIDPVSGRPVKHNIASVTVVMDTAAEADAYATALNVLGEEAAIALVEQENIAAYFIFYDNENADKDYRILYTDSFSQFLSQ